MAASKAGYILSLVGGIIGLVFSVLFFLSGIFAIISKDVTQGVIVVIVAGYLILSAILVIIGGVWMKNPKTCKKGVIVSIIFSSIGMGTLVGLIGGIMGVIDSTKK